MNQIFVHLNGKLVPMKEAKVSVFDHGFLYGDGIYESLRTHQGNIVDFKGHYQRLQESAKSLDIPLPYSEKEVLQWTEELLEKNKVIPTCSESKRIPEESRIRITLTRGENHFSFCGSTNPTFLISSTPLPSYEKEQKEGVVVTSICLPRLLPQVKSISLLSMILAKQHAQRSHAFETLLLTPEGVICEGSISNILLKKGNQVWKSKKERALSGTTQKRILDYLLQKKKYQLIEKDFSLDDLLEADEALLTNSIFNVLSVRALEKKQLKNQGRSLFSELRDFLTSDNLWQGDS